MLASPYGESDGKPNNMSSNKYLSEAFAKALLTHAQGILQPPILRVSKNSPCTVCGKPDWCSFTGDGALALCMRISAGSVRTAQNGAYVHPIYSRQEMSAVPTPFIKESGNSEGDRADADHLHRVYSYLLEDCLELTPEHGEHLLLERRLSDTAIAANLYVSIPGPLDWDDMCWALHNRFGDGLQGVPGFYKDKGRWKMPRCPGLIVPYRDVAGRIVGLQIRRDGDCKPKYLWFSTNPVKFPCGTSSGTPLHFAKPDFAHRTSKAIITEGALKADCICEFEDVAVIAIAGVSAVTPERLVSELRLFVPELNSVVLAFDMDWQEKPGVKSALLRLLFGMRQAGFKATVRTWDINFGKGLDDALIGRERMTA